MSSPMSWCATRAMRRSSRWHSPPARSGWKLPRSLRSAPANAPPSAESTVRLGKYRRIPVDEQCEVLSLIGDVAEGQDGPIVHAHVVLGLSDGTTRGGHLLEGLVFPTLEVVVTETPAEL